MYIHIITVFPSYFESPLKFGVLRIAQEKELVKIATIDLRDFTDDAYRTVDDYPFGGGAGMILKPEPIFKATESVREKDSYVILLSPKGRLFNQELALELASKPHLILICGRYKDVDERVRAYLIDDEISIGDYILAGGEAAALVILEAVVRLIDGVVGSSESVATDSFMHGLLDAPYYTRPQDFRGYRVPEVLLSGNHQKIAAWRKEQAIKLTKERRPDLYQKFLKSQEGGING